jgi:hypothetical protein
MYSQEIRERMTKDQLRRQLPLPRDEPLTEREMLMMENCYRRGFYQGFWSCLDASAKGFSISEMEEWLYTKLFRWRFARHGGKFSEPPWIQRLSQPGSKSGEKSCPKTTSN